MHPHEQGTLGVQCKKQDVSRDTERSATTPQHLCSIKPCYPQCNDIALWCYCVRGGCTLALSRQSGSAKSHALNETLKVDNILKFLIGREANPFTPQSTMVRLRVGTSVSRMLLYECGAWHSLSANRLL